jgi:hypothetical protein
VQAEDLNELGALPEASGARHETARRDDGLGAVEVVRDLVPAAQSRSTKPSSYLPFQLEKDLDTSLSKEEFMRWATERFKEDKTVSNAEDLFKLYSSPYLS